MFGTQGKGANAYQKVGLETGVVSASPHQLTLMLFDGALQAIRIAISDIGRNDIKGKGKAIIKATNIVNDGLRASLDKSQGGDIALNLDGLYGYIGNLLLLANVNNDTQKLDEAHSLLQELRSAWASIGQVATPAPNAEAAGKIAASA